MAINWTNTKLTGGTYGNSSVTQIVYQGGIYKFTDQVPLSSLVQGSTSSFTSFWDDDENVYGLTTWENTNHSKTTNSYLSKGGIVSGSIRLKSKGTGNVDFGSEMGPYQLLLVSCSSELDKNGLRNIPPYNAQIIDGDPGGYYEQWSPEKENLGIYPSVRGDQIVGGFDQNGLLHYIDNRKTNLSKGYTYRENNYIPKGYLYFISTGGLLMYNTASLLYGDTVYVDFSEASFVETPYADVPDDMKPITF